MRYPLIAGNWKMYKTTEEALNFAEAFLMKYVQSDVRVAICAPFTQLAPLNVVFSGTNIGVGAQNMHYSDEGAFTGEVSPIMLKEIGVEYCIVGHSERRQYFNETNESCNRKVLKALEINISPILCVGESLEQRDSGNAFAIVRTQLEECLKNVEESQVKDVVIAYEPIWAIGTGRTATPEQANEMAGYIRSVLTELYGEQTADEVSILYGGSVKPDNVEELMNMFEIDGALVGGASLNPDDFLELVNF